MEVGAAGPSRRACQTDYRPSLHQVALRSSPVNADSSGTLSGKTFDADAPDTPVARFGLSLRYREARP